MTDTVGSALVRRHIGRRLEALRRSAPTGTEGSGQFGMTQDEAAARLQRSRATLARMEAGDETVRFRDIEVNAMLDLYGASDEERQLVLALTTETRNGRRKGWWHDYTETALPEFFELRVLLEDSAEIIRQYETELVTGLLQTRGYAEEIHRVPSGYITEEETERRVTVRLSRQSLLTRPRAPRLDVILNEAVLARPVGGAEVMAAQFEHLLEVGRQANVSIRVLPFAAGVHGGMAASAPFSLLEFPRAPLGGELLEPPLAYVDTLTGAMYLDKPAEVDAYELIWQDIDQRSLDEASSRELITTALKGLNSG